MNRTVLFVVLVAATCANGLRAAPLVPYVRQVDYMVQTFSGGTCTAQPCTLFVLYVGNAGTECVDQVAERTGSVRSVCLVRPAAAPSPPGISTRDRGDRWYMTEIDSERGVNRRGPLLAREAWRAVPVIARQAYAALGQNEDLVLISWNGFSGSLSLYFTPAVQADRPFYERMLQVLRSYLEAHAGDDVPFERVDPAGPSGRLTAS